MPFRMPARFRSLRWRLTIYYAATILAALVIIQLLGIGGVIWFSVKSDLAPRLVANAAEQMTFHAGALLAAEKPDAVGMQAWLEALAPLREGGSGVIGLTGPLLGDARDLPDSLPALYDLATIIDAEGRLVASNVPTGLQTGWQTAPFVDPNLPVDSATIIERALAGEKVVQRLPDSTLVVAQPVLHSVTGELLGIAYLHVVAMAVGGSAWRTLLLVLAVVSVAMLFGRSTLATLFGYFTASWLTNRLQRLAQATQSWAKGEYEVIVHDVHDDELGQLARQLNWMAEQQHVMMEMREQLATLEERNRLARELHDSVKQQVFAAGMQIAAARSVMGSNPTQAGDYLEEAERLAQQTQQELTDLLLQLRPLALAGKGLTRAIREYLDGWGRRNGIAAEMQVQGSCRLRVELVQALYRVVQEALTNVARHAGTDRVWVDIEYLPTSVSVRIRDFGRGFDVEQAGGMGMGLSSMKERMADLGGEFRVQSQPGQGALILATAPLEDGDAGAMAGDEMSGAGG